VPLVLPDRILVLQALTAPACAPALAVAVAAPPLRRQEELAVLAVYPEVAVAEAEAVRL
jgi:hypothetical protein